jgi:hypothetical protein
MMHSMRIEDASEALQAVEAAEAAAGRMTEEERALCDEARAQEMAEEAKVKLDSMLAAQRAAQNTRVVRPPGEAERELDEGVSSGLCVVQRALRSVCMHRTDQARMGRRTQASLSPMEALRSARVSPETLTPRAQGKLDSDSVARVSPNLTTTAAKPRGKPAWNSNAKVKPNRSHPSTLLGHQPLCWLTPAATLLNNPTATLLCNSVTGEPLGRRADHDERRQRRDGGDGGADGGG